MMPLLAMKNITLHYEKVEALKNISLKVEKGSVVSLIGSNGAGKTTILRTIFGLKRPSRGEIRFDGQRIDGLAPPQIAKGGIAYSMEGRRLFPDLTVQENLEMGAYTRSDKKEIARTMEEIFERFPILKERNHQAAGTLSGGEQQMLAIGRALMSNPCLLLLDEPSLGLAPIIVKELSSIIRNINQSGVSVLLVEQNSKLGLGVADRGYLLEVGKIVLEGEAKDLRNNEHVKKIYLGV